MLKMNQKNIMYTMSSIINGEEVVTFVSTIKSDGTMLPISQNISNNDLYMDNITEINKDMMEMQSMIFKEQAVIMKDVSEL